MTGWQVVLPLLFYYLFNMFRATMCALSGTDDCVVLYPCVGMCRGCGKVVKTGWQLVRPLLFYKLLNMFRATMCPSSGADECVML